MWLNKLKILLCLIIIFLVGTVAISAEPTLVNLDHTGQEKDKLIKLYFDEEIGTCYAPEQEVNKYRNQPNFLETKNWDLKLFLTVDGSDFNREKTQYSAQLNEYGYDPWTIAVDVSYNHQKQTFKAHNIYLYDTKGKIIVALACKGTFAQEFAVSEFSDSATLQLLTAINSYLAKIAAPK